MSAQDTLLVLADAGGVPRRWRLLSAGAIVGRGDEVAQLPETRPWVRVVLAVPGTDVTLRWLELSDGLTPAQAAAAARLQVADETAEPIGDLLVAAGRAEGGHTPVALVPAARMAAWLEQARALALDPDVVLPAPLLLMPPGAGLVRYRGSDGVPDYRGTGQAFSVEDEIAALIVRDQPIADIDNDVREAGLPQVLAVPPINLRQGAFAKRREFAIDWARMRRLATYAAALLLVSLAIQLVVIMRTTFAADRYEAEALEARRAVGTPGRTVIPAGYAPAATAVFDAVRDTQGATLSQFVYQPDGTARASILADSPATVEALRARIEQRGMQAQGDIPSTIGGRTSSQIIVRPR